MFWQICPHSEVNFPRESRSFFLCCKLLLCSVINWPVLQFDAFKIVPRKNETADYLLIRPVHLEDRFFQFLERCVNFSGRLKFHAPTMQWKHYLRPVEGSIIDFFFHFTLYKVVMIRSISILIFIGFPRRSVKDPKKKGTS